MREHGRLEHGGDAVGRDTRVRAWDVPTRLFHWSLVTLMAATWVTFYYAELLADPKLRWHSWSGYALLVLVTWRLIWGFAGSSTARFSGFVRGPASAIGYAADLARGRNRYFLGHNPLGAWMVLILLALVAFQGVIGLFTVEHNDIMAGPLYRLVSEDTQKLLTRWHRLSFDWVILPAIAVHVAANVLYWIFKKEPLIPAMVTGLKPRHDYEDEREAAIVDRPMLRALVSLVIAAAVVLGTITALGGRL